jgi:DNA-directed DNA polymerase
MKKLVVIDGKSVFYRGYYAMENLSTADGTPTGGVYGFASLALEVIKKINPDYVVVAWDKKGTSTSKRTAIYSEYKAGRKTPPEDFYAQFPILKELLEALHWPLFECDGYEADDILGTISVQANSLGIESNLITSDLDMLQLISENTKVYAMKKGFSQIEEFNLKYFEEKYRLKQSQFLDLKSLQGDSSDNIPGVPGIGIKTATALLQEFNTLENIYSNLENIKPSWVKKLAAGKDLAFMSKDLAKIWTDAPVKLNLEDADITNFDYNKLLDIFKKLEFNSLILKIPKSMRTGKTNSSSTQVSLLDKNNTNLSNNFKKIDYESVDIFLEKIANENLALDIDNEGKIYIANDKKYTIINNKEQLKNISEKNKIIFYDAKNIFHQLDNIKMYLEFKNIYEIKQAEFLLNPLIRDKSISSIFINNNGFVFDENNIVSRLSAILKIYHNQIIRLNSYPKILDIAENYDFPLISILFEMEKKGVKIDPDFLDKKSKEFSLYLEKLEKDIIQLAGEGFNISSPLQLSKILFEKLALPTKGIKKTKNGYSTGQKELEKLKDYHPIIAKIEEFREYSKLKNTYIDALPKLADKNNRIHSTFNQDITSTGRLSSTNPNLQNIPIRSELGRQIRQGFISDNNNVIISADYSQFELRLAAALSNDTGLINSFKNNEDIHSKTASEMFNIPLDEVSKDQRRAAKVINFGVLYGMSAHRLASELGTNYYEAKHFIDNYFNSRKPIADFIQKTLLKAEQEGYVETFYGRQRPTPDIKSSNFIIRETAKRAAANMPIQGTEADLMKRAMIKIHKKITKTGLGDQILQIHDSILIESPKENAAKIAEILKYEMENIAPELPINLKVDINIGQNWLDI